MTRPSLPSRLDGQVALVTGASRGIGRTIAEHLAAAGASVALLARSTADLKEVASTIQASGGRALPLLCDVTDRQAVDNAIAEAASKLGPIDLLVNNAGLLSAIGPTWQLEPDAFAADIRVNILGVFLCCRVALPAMIQRGRGRIINMVGGGAKEPFPYANAYGPSKAAVHRFTETLDEELQELCPAVAAFAVNPGLVHTAMTDPALTTDSGRQWLAELTGRLQSGDHLPPDRAANLILRIAAGHFDALRGRFLNAEAEEVHLLRIAAAPPDEYALRLRIRE